MKLSLALVLVGPLALSACAVLPTLPSLPPSEVPTAPLRLETPAPPAEQWRPYSAGPLQNRFERKAARPGTDWGTSRTPAPERIERAPLPAPEPVSSSSAEWRPYSDKKEARSAASAAPAEVPSVFGEGVSSAWATDYVPEGYRTEFAIFSKKVASDGQARMTMPTGEVYSGSVVGRDGRCVTVEVGVTADGDLPLISRGLVRTCR